MDSIRYSWSMKLPTSSGACLPPTPVNISSTPQKIAGLRIIFPFRWCASKKFAKPPSIKDCPLFMQLPHFDIEALHGLGILRLSSCIKRGQSLIEGGFANFFDAHHLNGNIILSPAIFCGVDDIFTDRKSTRLN